MAKRDCRLPAFTEKNIVRYWSRLDKRGPDECWLWKGALNDSGYGSFSVGAFDMLAHRVAYFLSYGVDPGALHVCHKCDRPACQNPAHLFLGTSKDNMHDASLKGRMKWKDEHLYRTHPELLKRGEKNHSKLTEGDVLAIRELYAGGWLQRDIAFMFEVATPTIFYIINRKKWKHI